MLLFPQEVAGYLRPGTKVHSFLTNGTWCL